MLLSRKFLRLAINFWRGIWYSMAKQETMKSMATLKNCHSMATPGTFHILAST